ncbi:MAG: hypothetical protein AAB336_02460 [Acidobacteriota bacterium]
MKNLSRRFTRKTRIKSIESAFICVHLRPSAAKYYLSYLPAGRG